jgi:hypothetical protein
LILTVLDLSPRGGPVDPLELELEHPDATRAELAATIAARRAASPPHTVTHVRDSSRWLERLTGRPGTKTRVRGAALL